MSHDGNWRGACASTTRDRSRRWLWRLVGRARVGNTDGNKYQTKCSATSDPLLLRGYRPQNYSHVCSSFASRCALRMKLCAFSGRVPQHALQITFDAFSGAAHRNQPALPIAAWVRITTSFELVAPQTSKDRPTSKMSHDGNWREACVSTTRDRSRRWLWRLVRPFEM